MCTAVHSLQYPPRLRINTKQRRRYDRRHRLGTSVNATDEPECCHLLPCTFQSLCALTISGGTSVLVSRLMSSPSAQDGMACLRSSSSSRRVGTLLVVFFGAAATSARERVSREERRCVTCKALTSIGDQTKFFLAHTTVRSRLAV